MSYKVTINGESHTVTPENIKPATEGFDIVTPDRIPAGFVKQEVMNSTLGERIAQERSKIENQFLEDPERHKKIFSRYNIELGDDGKPKGIKTEEDVARKVQEAVSETESRYKGQVQSLKNRAISSEVLASLTKAGFKGPSILASSISEKFEIDDKGNVALKDGDGFAINPNGTTDRPYKTPGDYVESLKASEDWRGLFKSDKPGSSGFGGTGAGGSEKNQITRKQFDDLSPSQRAETVKSGVKIVD